MYRRVIVFVLLVVFALSLAACSGSQATGQTGDVIDDPEGAQVSAKTIDTEKLLSTPLKQETQQITSKAENKQPESEGIINKSGLSKPIKSSGDTITIYTNGQYLIGSPGFLYAKKLFQKKYPDKIIKVKQGSSKVIGGYDKEVNKKIMAGDKDFDIFFTSYPSSHLRNKTYYDLSDYTSLVSALKKMQSGIGKNCTYKNTVFGVPFDIAVLSWQLNENLAKKLGITVPEGSWTLDQFYDLAKKARKDSDGDGKADTYLAEVGSRTPLILNVIDQYNAMHLDIFNKKASYNNAQFIEILKLLKKLYSEDLLRELKPGEKWVRDDKNALLWHRRETGYDGLGRNRRIVYYPFIQGSKSYPFEISYFIMNKNSQNKELAAEFMQLHLSSYSKRLSPSIEQYYKENDAADKSAFIKGGGAPTKKNMDLFDNLINYGKVTLQDEDMLVTVFDRIDDYIEGKISAEEAVKKIEQKAKMIFNGR